MHKFATPMRQFFAKKLNEAGLKSLGSVNGNVFEAWAGEFYDWWEAQDKASRKRVKRAAFVPPTPEEATEYARSISFRLSGENFVSFYASKGWKVGTTPMVDWKAAIRTWKASAEPRDLLPEQSSLNGHEAPKEPVGWREWGARSYPQAVYWEGWSYSALPAHVRALIEKEMPKP